MTYGGPGTVSTTMPFLSYRLSLAKMSRVDFSDVATIQAGGTAYSRIGCRSCATAWPPPPR
jgi:hypothetical protein